MVSQTTKWLVDFHMINLHSQSLFSYPDCECLAGRDSFSCFLGLEVEELSAPSAQVGRNPVVGAQSLCWGGAEGWVLERTVCHTVEYHFLHQCRVRWQMVH